VRKMSFGQGVERIFPFNSKVIEKIEKIRSYKVRRAKLFTSANCAQGCPPEGSGPRCGQGISRSVFHSQTTPAFAGVVFCPRTVNSEQMIQRVAGCLFPA